MYRMRISICIVFIDVFVRTASHCSTITSETRCANREIILFPVGEVGGTLDLIKDTRYIIVANEDPKLIPSVHNVLRPNYKLHTVLVVAHKSPRGASAAM